LCIIVILTGQVLELSAYLIMALRGTELVRFFLIMLLLGVVLFVPVVGAASEKVFFDELEWSLKKDKRGIQVYTARVPESKHRAVFTTMRINSELSEVVALLMDFENCRKWAKTCKELEVVSSLSETTQRVYAVVDLPFPAKDRDSISLIRWEKDNRTGIVSMESNADPLASEGLDSKYIHMTYAHVLWRIVPSPKGLIIENYAHLNPNGALPVWLTNLLSTEEPYKTLRRMRARLNEGHYQNANISWLNN